MYILSMHLISLQFCLKKKNTFSGEYMIGLVTLARGNRNICFFGLAVYYILVFTLRLINQGSVTHRQKRIILK